MKQLLKNPYNYNIVHYIYRFYVRIVNIYYENIIYYNSYIVVSRSQTFILKELWMAKDPPRSHMTDK